MSDELKQEAIKRHTHFLLAEKVLKELAECHTHDCEVVWGCSDEKREVYNGRTTVVVTCRDGARKARLLSHSAHLGNYSNSADRRDRLNLSLFYYVYESMCSTP